MAALHEYVDLLRQNEALAVEVYERLLWWLRGDRRRLLDDVSGDLYTAFGNPTTIELLECVVEHGLSVEDSLLEMAKKYQLECPSEQELSRWREKLLADVVCDMGELLLKDMPESDEILSLRLRIPLE